VELVHELGAFRADQFRAEGNFRAHFLHTGPEILRQAQSPIDLFCDFAGTGGTFAGCAAAFKQANPRTQCYVIEPEGAAALAGEPVRNARHRIQGGGYAMPHLDLVRAGDVAGYLQVPDTEAVAASRDLASQEGVFAGFSTGANLAGARQLLQRFRDATCVIIANDSGLKYLSTDLWQ